eukprot:Skav212003  [mRNA]  locus=scaffold304:157332:157943:+ [translate_table: standard]
MHTVLLRSDGSAVACGWNDHGQCNLPRLEEGLSYTQVAAGRTHTVLLRSDGRVVACGDNADGQCAVRRLEEGLSYTHIAAGDHHTVLLRSDGSAIAFGRVAEGQCDIPKLEPGVFYVGDGLSHPTQPLQLEFLDATVLCSNLAGEEVLRIAAEGADSLWDLQKRIAHELKVSLPDLRLVLPDGQLLAPFCQANPAATVADVHP